MIKSYLFAISILFILGSCSTPNLLITDANDFETIATIDTIQYLNPKDHQFSASLYTPYTNPEFNRNNISVGWGVDAHWRNIKYGEVQLTLGNRTRSSSSPTVAEPIDGVKNAFKYHFSYNFPVLRWQKDDNSYIKTNLKVDNFRYSTICNSFSQKSLNLRVSIHNDIFYQTSSSAIYANILSAKYPFNSNGDYYYTKRNDPKILLEQSTTVMRFGIGLNKIKSIIIGGSHSDFGDFQGKKNRFRQFYLDFMLLLNNSEISPVIYEFSLSSHALGSEDIFLSDEAEFEPFIEKQSWGACFGYYQEVHMKSSPVILTLKSECGIRPGYFYESKWNENYYFQLGIGIGGWFQLNNKK